MKRWSQQPDRKVVQQHDGELVLFQEASARIAALEAQIAERDKPCIWKPYFVKDRLMNYIAGCGMVTLEQAGSFCPYCGHKIAEAK